LYRRLGGPQSRSGRRGEEKILDLTGIRMIKLRRMTWAGHVTGTEEKRNAYRILEEKPKGKRPLGRPKRRWVDNIKID
jgi:hypothetical protein